MSTKRSGRIMVLVSAAAAGLGSQAHGATWNLLGGFGNNWSNNSNWTSPATFPNAAGAVADVNNNLTSGQTINLATDITIGTLNLGDSDGSNPFTIAASVPGSRLIFESATAGGATALSVSAASFPNNSTNNTISAGVKLGGTSNLTINMTGTAANAQPLVFTGQFDVNGNTLFQAGVGIGQVSLSGAIVGSGQIVKNGSNTLLIGGLSNTTTAGITVNNGSLTMFGEGSLSTASSITINGYNTSTPAGGRLNLSRTFGGKATQGQRLSTTSLIFNGGYLNDAGQTLTGPSVVVQDTVATVAFNSGYSLVDVSTGGGSTGTTLNATTVTRQPGATLGYRIENASVNNRFLIGNASSFLVGGAGAADSPSISIIPWITVSNQNYFNPGDFATYDATQGVRALRATEVSTNINTAAANENVKTGGFSLSADKTINSLVITDLFGGTTNMGAGRTLTVASGGVLLLGSDSLGGAGSASAGTLAFGSAEGIVSVRSGGSYLVGAAITGTGGLTKGGPGTLTLAGLNTYTGKTHIGSGTVRVGNGTVASKLGSDALSDVIVADGAILRLSSIDSINDGATLSLSHNGYFYGMVQLDITGTNEIVGGLFLNGVQQLAGTYGGAGSGATYVLSEYFSGTGQLEVVAVPEPASVGALAAGLGLLCRRRRK